MNTNSDIRARAYDLFCAVKAFLPQSQADNLKAILDDRDALKEALKLRDWDCDYCAYKRRCIEYDCDGECKDCGITTCECRLCRNNSNWTWGGERKE